jgi:hypothetical protein
MQFNFQEIINQLNQGLPQSDNFAFRMARAVTIPGDYVLNTILPQQDRPDFHVSGATMSIYPTMLGQVAMDTVYPPMGAISSSQFFENTTKLAGQIPLDEKTQRDLIAWENSQISVAFRDGVPQSQIASDINARRMNTVIGFSSMLLKSHWDTYEWLRGQALTTGKLDWTFGKIPLKVDYNVPTGNKKTNSGNNRYGGSTSKFWDDMRFLSTKLNNFRIITNSNTWYTIIDNSVNNIRVVVNDGLNREIIKFVGTTETNSTDARDRVRMTIYDKSGTVIDAKTGELTALPFIPDGYLIVVGEQNPDGFQLSQGSVADPDNLLQLGYTHIAPTIEGQGRPGIWSRIYTPEGKSMQLLAETCVNMLPVILNPKKLVILQTDMA